MAKLVLPLVDGANANSHQFTKQNKEKMRGAEFPCHCSTWDQTENSIVPEIPFGLF